MIRGILLFSLFAVFLLLKNSLYTVSETEHILITEFGRLVGNPITDAGLYWKKPFVQNVNRIEKRVIEWDGLPSDIPTKDKLFVEIDTFARWRISDVKTFYAQVRDIRSALSRINDVVDSDTRKVVANYNFNELVRSLKDRKVQSSDIKKEDNLSTLKTIEYGRNHLEKEIIATARPTLASYGIELIDMRFKRINYNEEVLEKIYTRMSSERIQLAERFLSEGKGEAQKIQGQREKEERQIVSGAYRQTQEIRGKADAEATEIYAKAYNQTPQARELFEFVNTLEAYKKTITKDTTLIFSMDSDLFKSLKGN
jgi:membrane protease subunit HflC